MGYTGKQKGKGGGFMFDSITTLHYGRCVKQYHDWYVKSFAVNRIYYLHSGSVTVLLDGVPHPLEPGLLYFFPQSLRFELQLQPDTRVDHTFLDFVSTLAIKMDRYLRLDLRAWPLAAKAADILFALAERYATYPYLARNDYTALTESYLENLLILLDKIEPTSTVTDPRINRALEDIRQHYSENLTLEQLAHTAGLEKNYFIRLFRRSLNQTPYQYLKTYRFNLALAMLKQGQPVSDVALHVGYSDLSAFSHAFRRLYGFYPSELSNRSGPD